VRKGSTPAASTNKSSHQHSAVSVELSGSGSKFSFSLAGSLDDAIISLDWYSAFDRSGGFVPMHRLPAEVRLVGHVASERGMMTEECVFDDWTA